MYLKQGKNNQKTKWNKTQQITRPILQQYYSFSEYLKFSKWWSMICRNQWLTMGGGRMFANSGFSIDTGSCSLYGATISLGIGRPFSLLCSCALHWYYRKCARQVLYCDKHQPSHRLIRSELIKMSQFWDLLHLVLVANQHHRTYAIERIQWFFFLTSISNFMAILTIFKKRPNTNNCHCQKSAIG